DIPHSSVSKESPEVTHIYHTFTHDIKSFDTSLDAHPVPEDITSSDNNKHSVRQLIQTEDTRIKSIVSKKTLNGNKAKTTTKRRHNKQKTISDESEDNCDHNWEQTSSDEEMDDKNEKKKRKYVKKSEKSGENPSTTPLKRRYKEKTILSANGKRFRPKNFICDYIGCDKQFDENENLLAHIRVRHTKERPFECDVCHKTFPTLRYLKSHQKLHTDTAKPFVCSWVGCDSAFRINQCLVDHMQTHQQLRQFACDECDQRFNLKRTLQVHKNRVHSTARPYTCDWPACEATYKDITMLKRHKETHLGVRQYVCDR
ncbi:unnamed protein product, partial [Medioppia subpectinata]